MTTCSSTKEYDSDMPNTLFKSTDFSCNLRDPQILPIVINTFVSNDKRYINNVVNIGNPGDVLTYIVTLEYAGYGSLGSIDNSSCQTVEGIGASKEGCTIFANGNPTVQRIVLNGDNRCAPNPNSYVKGDTYTIDLAACLNGANKDPGIKVTFFRPSNFTVTSSLPVDPPICYSCQCLSGNVEVPQIFIETQTSLDGSDISNTIFRICDKYAYYGEERLVLSDKKCETQLLPSSKLRETSFNRYCPLIVSVLKGKGKNAQDKAIYLAKKYNINNSYDLYYNIILYAMTKYILARILYGKFDIKYLLGKYNEQFLSNLKHSRFCKFLEFFALYPNYNRYFKWDCKNKF